MYWSAAGTVYVKACRIKGAVILMYHSVPRPADERWIDPRNRICPGAFVTQMRFLARHRRVIPMSRLIDMLDRRDDIMPGTVILTFDDGYRDTMEVAAAILQRYSLPALLYLPTGCVSRGETHWADRLWTLFTQRTRDRLVLDESAPGLHDLSDRETAQRAYTHLAGRLLTALRPEREALLSEIAAQLRAKEAPPCLTLTWDDVRSMRSRFPLFAFGTHTVDHTDLSSHEGGIAESELRQCVTDFQCELGEPPRHFSFPYGRYSRQAAQLAMSHGLRSAVASSSSDLVCRGADPFCLPRVCPPRSLTLFRFWTSGAYPGLTRTLLGRS